MTTAHPTTTWEAMQDGSAFYRKQEFYSMCWEGIDLENYIISAAGYGGPIALIRDSTKVVVFGKNASSQPSIQIFSSAGNPLRTIQWDQGRIAKMGWTYDERLVALNEEGVYRVYDLQGEYAQYSLGADAQETGVIDARIHETGMVVLTGHLQFLEVKGWDGGKPLALADAGLHEAQCWAVIPPDQTISRHVEVLVGHGNTILSVDNLESVDQRLSRGPFTYIAISPNGKSLALYLATGTLWVVSPDFQQSYAEVDLSTENTAQGCPPTQLVWCGNDALTLVWPHMVLLAGPFGETLQYFYPSLVYAVGEIDGVRLIGAEHCDFIQKVPVSSEKVFRPGSTSPAAILFDAHEAFGLKSPKADESIRGIRAELASAVDTCIDAAGQEFEPYWQKKLLNAAIFGRAFLDLYNPSDFVNMGQTLKVLNTVRHYEIGVPITHAQYTHASPAHLISRLTSRNLHLLALRISAYIHVNPEPVLKHWACAKIDKSAKVADEADEDEVCRTIVRKFEEIAKSSQGMGDGTGVSYADIAKRAWAIGKAGLATKLLNYEPKAADQVPLLLSMKEERLALTKAIDSGDTDLVYLVLLHLLRQSTIGDFFKLLDSGGPALAPASALLEVYAKEQNKKLLKDYWFTDDRRTESAKSAIEEAGLTKDPVEIIALYKEAAKFFSEDRDRTFEAKVTDESIKLFTAQQQLEKDMDDKISVFGLCVNDTITACLKNGLTKKADRMKLDFKVPDKRFWYIKLHALTANRDWDALETFAKSKKSPIGYEPFVEYLVAQGHPKKASVYVPRCDAKLRGGLYEKCQEWRLAAVEWKERGDKAKIQGLRKRAPNDLAGREIDQILSTMG